MVIFYARNISCFSIFSSKPHFIAFSNKNYSLSVHLLPNKQISQKKSFFRFIIHRRRVECEYPNQLLQWLTFEWDTSREEEEESRQMNHNAIRSLMIIMQHSTQMVSLFYLKKKLPPSKRLFTDFRECLHYQIIAWCGCK